MIGRTLAANWAACASRAHALYCAGTGWSRGVPSCFPRAFAAARARSEMASRSCSATAARIWMVSLLANGISAATHSTPDSHESRHEGKISGELIQLAMTSRALCLRQASMARASSG